MRSEDITDTKEQNEYKYIVYSQSSQHQFQTASPPDPPTNLFVESTTCHAVKICWDPPVDHGSELLATRIDCYPLKTENPIHIFKELTPDTKSCIIENLSEKTKYRITITVITEEYLVYHKIKETSQIPNSSLNSSKPWLPSAQIDVMTAGTEPATQLTWTLKHDNSIFISWKSPRTYGTNCLVNQVLCYQKKNGQGSMATQIPIQANAIGYKLADLLVGSKYRIWIEAVVSIRLNIESSNTADNEKFSDETDLDRRINFYKELKDNRCINVASEHLLIRVPAPCEPPIVSLTGYTSETIDIYWPRPNMYSQHKDVDIPGQKIHLYRKLIGYQLLVNEIQQRSLQWHETSCTLIKCKPLHTYNIVIKALTCLPDKELDKLLPLVDTEPGIEEIDESSSHPLQVKTFAFDKTDQMNYLSGQYEDIVDPDEEKSIGRIRVEWSVEDDSSITQFNVIWFSATESINQRKSVDASTRMCYVPVTASSAIYEIKVVTVYEGRSKNNLTSEVLFIETAGKPEAPCLWLNELKDNQAAIQWSVPRVYPLIPISGYQVYLNDVKVSKVDKHTLKTILSLKINK